MVTSTTHDHIRRELRYVLDLNDRERLEFMEQPTLLKYPAADEIVNELERLLKRPKRPRMGNLLIVGESNNGKTTIVQKFHENHGTAFVNPNGKAVKPIIVVEAPPTADEKSLHFSILDRFHAPFRPTAPTSQLRLQAVHLLRECDTRMLIIDELHSLMAGAPRKQLEVMNTIKFLCNELQIPIVGVGTQVAVNVLRTDAQHTSRFRVIPLARWKLDPNFRNLLVGFDKTLPLRRKSNLADKETMRRLYTVCNGNLGNLREGLVACARTAIEKGTEQITPELITKMEGRFKVTAGTSEPEPKIVNGPSR